MRQIFSILNGTTSTTTTTPFPCSKNNSSFCSKVRELNKQGEIKSKNPLLIKTLKLKLKLKASSNGCDSVCIEKNTNKVIDINKKIVKLEKVVTQGGKEGEAALKEINNLNEKKSKIPNYQIIIIQEIYFYERQLDNVPSDIEFKQMENEIRKIRDELIKNDCPKRPCGNTAQWCCFFKSRSKRK